MRVSRSLLGAVATASSLTFAAPALAQAPAPTPAAPAKPAPKPAPAAPKPTPRPAAAPATQAPQAPINPGAGVLDIRGFRTATFGMTPAQVKIAIANDFGPTAKTQEGSDPATGTQFILVQVEHLEPGPGPAKVGYVFGATSKTLTNVNVVWSTGAEATEPQRAAIATAGEQLVAYFQQGPVPAKASTGIAPIGSNGLMLYTAVDKKNAAVQVMIDGVSYQSNGGPKPVASPPPKGPATLRIAYALDIDKPDVKSLKPGSF